MAIVFLCDHDVARSTRIATVVAHCGVRTVRFGQSSSDMRGAQALVVAVDGPSSMSPHASDALCQAGSAGLKAIVYASGVSSWNVIEKCKIMLCGASRLLDCETLDFDVTLQRELTRLLQEAENTASEQAALQRQLSAIGCVAQSSQMLQVFRLVTRLAQLSDIPVLIEGESGTGKELVALALHRFDPKREHGPFIAVNCAAISHSLAESELFGHARGSFTGAERQRKGWWRAAAGGVLFLDEIGEMSLDLQAKMLRILQDGRVLAVGDEQSFKSDVRVIAATNRSLSSAVSEGRFRADLYHRLNVVPVRIPPLRERPEDIEPLLEHFVGKHRRLLAAPCAVSREFSDAMRHLPLPGNARELENIVRQTLLGKRDTTPLTLSDLPAPVWQDLCMRTQTPVAKPGMETVVASNLGQILSTYAWKLSDSLSYCEREMIGAALARTNGNRTKAAQLLGITPRSIYNKLRRPHP
jgi:transcriptional regulator with GAF, ATPase, and Fis domain